MRSWLQRLVDPKTSALAAALLGPSVARRVAVRAGAVAVIGCAAVGLAVVLVVLRGADPATVAAVRWIAILGGTVTVGVVTLATVVTVERTLARPLRALTEVVRAAERGKYLAAAKTTREDELGDLSRAFDRLCVQITDLSVLMIDNDRELAVTRREAKLTSALGLLLELTEAIDVQADLDAFLAGLPARVAPLLDADRMTLLVADDPRSVAVVRGATGFPDDASLIGLEVRLDAAPWRGAGDPTSPIVIADLEADPRWDHLGGRARLGGLGVLLPLALHGRVLGFFGVFRARAATLTSEDLALLRSLASSTALALAHAAATVNLRELTVTDDLTGVANRRLLSERAQIELERARRTGQPLSALVIDLDHFKLVNDALGHLRGDQLLRDVARVLIENVRRADTVARFGGEEFVVLLPDSSREQALLAAEKLRAQVAESCRGSGGPQTISVGVATFPEDASTFAELLDHADQALFVAKRTGRDRVVAFERPAADAGDVTSTRLGG